MARTRIDVSALRRNLFDVITAVASGDSIEVMRHGRVVAVLSPPAVEQRDVKPRIDHRRLGRLCKRRHIKRLALFGSVLRDDFGPDSDVDVLVDPEPGHLVRIGEITEARADLAKFFGRSVDMLNRFVVERGTNPIRRRAILESAKVIYEAR